jgi:hypothetical protein
MLTTRFLGAIVILTTFLTFISCHSNTSHEEMIKLLQEQRKNYNNRDNYYASDVQVDYYDSLIRATPSAQDKMFFTYDKCYALIAVGREDEAIPILEEQVNKINREGIHGMDRLKVQLALAYLRSGERTNCIANHTGETCILPIQGSGIHKNQEGSRNAIRIYEALLETYPENLEYRWLLNIAYMTLGEYPAKVPAHLLIPNVSSVVDTTSEVHPFKDIASATQLDINDMAGGVIVDDFDNDGYLDIITSSWDLDVEMHFFKNNADGTFIDKSEESHLNDLRGGLNLMQMDFNNDGWKDIFVLRGAWLRGNYGLQPNSLIRNNGDGTFTDVTTTSGMLSFHPTQTATWNDFNNDGWVDVFIGNETWDGNKISGKHPCELYLNKQDGTFVNVAAQASCAMTGFIKGVTSADYNRDGWKDIFITSLSGERYLLKNNGLKDHIPMFEDVTHEAKLDDVTGTFPTWFWDYNNDGWMDILAGNFSFDKPIATYFAEESLGDFNGTSGALILYRNNHDGTFGNVSKEVGLDHPAFAMAGNFGDIDNDGFLDFYLGTGNPELESIVPNKMFKNIAGQKFVDVTTAARVGHLQKGHAIAFADIDNDGDQDIYSDLGGAYKGDSFHSSFYLNPGQNKNNHWVALDLIAKDNKSVIGTSISLTFKEGEQQRKVHLDVNSGGSFGASPLRKEIGLGSATEIEELTIHWHPGTDIQTFRNLKPDRVLRIRQGIDQPEIVSLHVLNFEKISGHHH